MKTIKEFLLADNEHNLKVIFREFVEDKPMIADIDPFELMFTNQKFRDLILEYHSWEDRDFFIITKNHN